MNFPENIKVSFGGEEFEIRPYLTKNEALSIIISCVDLYDNGGKSSIGETIMDEIPGWDKSMFLMEEYFNEGLIHFCTNLEDYNYDAMVATGAMEEIRTSVVNARDTFSSLWNIIEKRDSMACVIERFCDKLLEKIPTTKEMGSLFNKIKKELESGSFDKALNKIGEMAKNKI